MNLSKKAVGIFLLGILVSAAVFGGAWFIGTRKPTAPVHAAGSAGQQVMRQELEEFVARPMPIGPGSLPPPAGPVPLQKMGIETISTVPGRTAVAAPLFENFLSPKPDARSTVYPVKAGDTLTSIARKHGVTIDLLRKINQLSGDKLIPAMKLKIPTSRLSLVIDKSQNTLILKADEEILKTYMVSTGSNNSTPVGTFKITDKLMNPTWYKTGAVVPSGSPANVLGTRWMGITAKGYGIHGTTEPEKLGQQVTAGCVRMKNEDVEELYSLVPAGTEVTILD